MNIHFSFRGFRIFSTGLLHVIEPEKIYAIENAVEN